MASTDFTDNSTVILAAWLDDVDVATYSSLSSVAGTNTITATGPVPMSAYASGQMFRFIPANDNTGATTINITPSGGSALGAKNIFFNGAACAGGEIQANMPCLIIYDGTQFNLIGPFCGGSVASKITILAGGLVATAGNGVYVCDLTNSGDATPSGVFVNYTGAAPNGTTNFFFDGRDTGGARFQARSNGGLANYQANDVNLSTREAKNSIRCYTDAELLKYEAFLDDVDFGIWKYNDQTHDDWNHGPTVEGVQAALRKYGLSAEEESLVGEFSENRLGLYTHDFVNVAIASLVASNKRLRERIAVLEKS